MNFTKEWLEERLKSGKVKLHPGHEIPEKKKNPRVNSNSVIIDGIEFKSTSEGLIYIEYRDDPNIKILELQPKFELIRSFKRNGKKIQSIDYTSDFRILENKTEWVVEVKSSGSLKANSKSYPMRRKLFLYKYPHLRFREIIFDKGKITVREW